MTCHKISGLTALALTFMFAACGGDSGSNADEKLAVVSSIDKLDDCTDKLEGDTVFVKSEKADYICSNGKWINADSSETQSDNELSSSSSQDESPSSSDFHYKQDSTAYIQPPVVAIKNKSITGVSQKGPFVTGTPIKVYELDGKTYAQTGKSFTGKITSDDGKFSVSNVSLASQYALLEANGYYRNEVTGEKSKGAITLYAITDLSDRKNVNINPLTHLEYERVLYLVGTGINIPAAKKQAEAEILNAFGISGKFESSEDLDIFSEGEGNAALLAISVMMLGGLGDSKDESSEAELTERLAKFAADIEKDGTWDDEETKAAIADWASEAKIDEIQYGIKEWKLSDVIPAFEKYVRNFWHTNYGLSICNSENSGVVAAAKNSLVQKYLICRDGKWERARKIEVDTYLWEAGEDGELREGRIYNGTYKYEKKLGAWTIPRGNYDLIFGGCTSKKDGNITKDDEGSYYVCHTSTSSVWSDDFMYYSSYAWEMVSSPSQCSWPGCVYWDIPTELNVISNESGNWTDGEFWVGPSTNTLYKYDETLKKWQVARSTEISLEKYAYNFGACTTKRKGEMIKDPYKEYSDNYYLVCTVTDEPVPDEYSEYSELYSSLDWNSFYLTADEIRWGICKSLNDGQINHEGTHICENGEWRKLTAIEKKYGLCNTSNDGQATSDNIFICTNGKWNIYPGVIDDFDDGNTIVESIEKNVYWYLFKSGGTFSNTYNAALGSWNMIETEGNNSYAAMKDISNITAGSEKYNSVGMGFDFDDGTLAGCAAIQYDYKGSGHYLRGLVDGVAPDYSFEHTTTFQNASSNWITVTVTTMKQPDWVVIISPSDVKPFSWEGVRNLVWVVSENLSQENIGTYLYIDNVKCIP